jgi:hypothetical protein
MPNTIGPAPVSWLFTQQGNGDMVECVCRDSVTQREYRFQVPLHTLPPLMFGIDDLIDAHPADFPDVVAHQFD